MATTVEGWLNNGMSGSGITVLTDGAKRDRIVWSGDLGVSAVTAYVSTGDTLSVKNDLDTLFAMQDAAGGLPYSGPELNAGTWSDTYHLWALIAVVDYYLYSGDQAWLLAHWSQIERAIQFSTTKIDTAGLLSVDLLLDWGRQSPGGEEISANALLYHALQGASFLATVVGDPVSANQYAAQASELRTAIQSRLWDSVYGMYRDVPGSSLYPQDGNALALWFGIPDSATDRARISANLRLRWNSCGVPKFLKKGSQPLQGIRVSWVDHQGQTESSQGLSVLAERHLGHAQVGECVGVLRADRQCSLEGLQRLLVSSQRKQRRAVVVVVDGLGWIQGNGPADQFQRGLVVTLLLADHPEQVQDARVVGLAVKDAAIDLLRLGKSSFLMQAEGVIEG